MIHMLVIIDNGSKYIGKLVNIILWNISQMVIGLKVILFLVMLNILETKHIIYVS